MGAFRAMRKISGQWKICCGMCAVLGLLLASCSTPAASQTGESSNPILEMLDHVPESAAQQEGLWISYVDYEVALNSRGVAPITAEQAQDLTQLKQWFTTLGYLESDLSLQQLMGRSTEMDESVGFTTFDVHREIVFGQPQSRGVVLAG